MNKIATQGDHIPTSEIEKFLEYIQSDALSNPKEEVQHILKGIIKERSETNSTNNQSRINLLSNKSEIYCLVHKNKRCMAKTLSMPLLMNNGTQKRLITPIDTVLYENHYFPGKYHLPKLTKFNNK